MHKMHRPVGGGEAAAKKPVGRWNLVLALNPGSAEGTPMFLQIARALSEDMRRGRLRPGARLPGSRSLAESLGVHRNTVIAAYTELLSEGWIEARHGRGTYVSLALPEQRLSPFCHTPRSSRVTRSGLLCAEVGPVRPRFWRRRRVASACTEACQTRA